MTAISLFNLFSIGIGPSSSHTVGPMKAARAFAALALQQQQLTGLKIELFGSLAYTGRGHGTDAAILSGLEGHEPDTVDPDSIRPRAEKIARTQQLHLLQKMPLTFDIAKDLLFNLQDLLPGHSNGMRFTALDSTGKILVEKIYYSTGGGFIVCEGETSEQASTVPQADHKIPFPFSSMRELMAHCDQHQLEIHSVMLANECAFRTATAIKKQLLALAQVMRDCIDRGCAATEKILPGGLNIRRRAPILYQKLQQTGRPVSAEQTDSLTWLNLYAIAVNEENAAGKRVVTAPTNGAAGIIPAVLYYWMDFYPHAKNEDILTFLLTAGAIAILYKKGASISGAEAGCQGEVGVACSMAAAGYAALLGGTTRQIENAAEIAMEHHLGMTCDPVAGLVQIPCIERNAMGAVKAVNAARLALLGDGQHFVSLDRVIATMKQTGHDMMSIYKETSLGGLAANLPEC